MSYTRRDFFKHGMVLGGGMVANDVLSLATHITQGMISNAHASDNNVKRVLSFYAGGGAPNWMFDQALYPHEEKIPASVRIEGLGTGFDENGKSIFVQKKKGDYWFPRIWFNPIPTSAGTWVSPESLLLNMMTIRGMWNPTDGHDLANKMIYRPLGTNYSVHGMIADAVASTYPIPGIVSGNDLIKNSFGSSRGISPMSNSSGTEVIKTIQSSFKDSENLYRNNSAIDSLVSKALQKMDDYSIFKKSSSNFNRKNADILIRTNMVNLLNDFTLIRYKYDDLIKKAIMYIPGDANTHVPDLFNLPITKYNSEQWNPSLDKNQDRYYAPGSDLRNLFLEQARIYNIAESFALAEILMINNLSSNIVCGIGGMTTVSPIMLRETTNAAFSRNQCGWNFDDGHNTGLSSQTFIWSVYYRAFITCLYEFTQTMEAKNLYDDTVISFSSDFARSPQSGGRGSDHGWQASSTSFWTGELTTPVIVGHTALDAGMNGYTKLWGVGKKLDYLGNTIGFGNMNATFATLARATPNTANNKSLVIRDGNKIIGVEAPKTT